MWSDHLKTGQKSVWKVKCWNFRCWVFRWIFKNRIHLNTRLFDVWYSNGNVMTFQNPVFKPCLEYRTFLNRTRFNLLTDKSGIQIILYWSLTNLLCLWFYFVLCYFTLLCFATTLIFFRFLNFLCLHLTLTLYVPCPELH